MKAILISIKPRYVADILNHKKVIEIRKSYPRCDLPIDVYIYCTKDNKNGLHWNTHKWVCVNNDTDVLKEICFNGKVVAKFTLNKVEKINSYLEPEQWYKTNDTSGADLIKKSCLTFKELDDYLLSGNGYAWHIDNLEIFNKPKELSEFYGTKQYFVGCGNAIDNTPRYAQLHRASQSWCYVEVELCH